MRNGSSGVVRMTFLAGMLGSIVAGAETNRVIDIPDVVVTADKEGLAVKSILGEMDIERPALSGTVDGLLENSAGIDLGRRSFAGNESRRLRIRGFDESRSLVLLNGRSLHGAGVYGGYYVDWASLSLENVKSVELIRGVAPAKYGNTLGGVVNILTADPVDEMQTKLSAAGGSLGTWSVRGGHAAPLGPLACNLTYEHYETDGYLRNAWFDRDSFGIGIDYTPTPRWQFGTEFNYSANESGMPVYNMPDAVNYDPSQPDSLGTQLGGPGLAFKNQPSTGPYYWGDGTYWEDQRFRLDVDLAWTGERASLKLGAYLMDQDRTEYFHAIDDPDRLILQRETTPEDNNYGWYAAGSWSTRHEDAHRIEYGAEGRYLGYGDALVSSVDPAYFMRAPTDSYAGDDKIQALHGVYVDDTWRIAERIDARMGLRLDAYEAEGPEAGAPTVDETGLSPRLAVTFHAWEGGDLSARFGIARRYPTLPEYYWWHSGYQPDERDDLRSEKAFQYELEVDQEMGQRLTASLRGYYYDVDHYIRTLFGYSPSRVVYNIDNVRFWGSELEVRYAFGQGFSVWGSTTWQKTRKEGDVLDAGSAVTDELTELPEYKIKAGIDYLDETGLHLRLSARYVDPREERTGWAPVGTTGGLNFETLDAFVDVDLQASYPLYRRERGPDIRATLVVDNILDDEIVEEYGYPLPGITAMAGIQAEF